MSFNPFHSLKNEAENEAYIYFDQHIRPLPKNKDGSFNFLAPGFNENDVDAFRHAYVSGVFTQEYGDRTADFLGLMNEYSPEGQYSHSVDPRSRNMDLWNNRIGRKYGKKTGGRKTLLKFIRGALKKGELIIDLNDPREFSGSTKMPKRISKPVIALTQSSTGRNQTYYDLQKRTMMTNSEFVALIWNGNYPGYSVKQIKGLETPVSKRDQKKKNNIE
jgi:hypothetical protein